MKQTIEIEVPDGKKAVWKDKKVVFEDIKPQLPKTWEKFCETHPIDYFETFISNNSFISLLGKRKRNKLLDRNALPNDIAAEAHLALMQLHQLRDCYRQGWEPDLVNTKTEYIINNIKGRYEVKAIIGAINHFLSFQSEEIADEFLNNFRDLIEQARDLI